MVTENMNEIFPPTHKWRLDQIQHMLNHIEGYENVVIEFQYKPTDSWNKDHYECTCGIRETNIDGWLLKYEFIIDAKNESELKFQAWDEMTRRLITDVWRTSINSFRNEQKQIMTTKQQRQMALQQEIEQKLTGTNTTNIINETDRMNMKLMNNIQTNNTTWNEPIRWFASIAIVATFLYAMYALYKYELFLPTFFTLACIWSVATMIIIVKESINRLLD